MERRYFIKSCGWACLGIASLSTILEACQLSHYYANYSFEKEVITIKKQEFMISGNEKKEKRNFILIKSEKLSYPVVIFQLNDTDYSALLLECTHKSCELQPQANYLLCPCHGSEFNHLGIVQNPPAEDNLKSFKVNADNENIYLHLN
jgi:cytochrome b6-f complex iron-sulfur subunit